MVDYIYKVLKRAFLFFCIVISLLVTVAFYGSPPKDMLILIIVLMVFLSTPFILTLNEGQKVLNVLFKKDIFGISVALFYAGFFTTISYLLGISLFETYPVALKFFAYTILICIFFAIAHKPHNESSFTLRDFIILFSLIAVYSNVRFGFSAQSIASSSPLLTIFIAMRSLPYNIALLIFFAKRNMNPQEFSFNFRFGFIDSLYFFIFLPVILLILYFSGYSFQPFLDMLSLKLIIFKISFSAITGAIPEEIFFRSFLISTLFSFFQKRFKGTINFVLSLLISSVIFGMYHINNGIWEVFWTTIWGLIFGFVFIKTRSLSSPILLHSVLNAILWK